MLRHSARIALVMLFVTLRVINTAVFVMRGCITALAIHSVTPNPMTQGVYATQFVMALVMSTGALVMMEFIFVIVMLVVLLDAICITLVRVTLLVMWSLANCGGINGCKNIT